MPLNENPGLFKRIKRWPWAVIRMILLALVLLLLIITCIILETSRLKHDKPHSSEDRKYHQNMVDKVNNAKSTWKAAYNKFGSRASEEASGRATPIESIKENMNMVKENLITESKNHIKHLIETNVDLPENFDSRLEWPLCWSVHYVPNQGRCGSCWAMSATAVMSDRICIHSNGTDQPQISAQDLTSCCSICGGCRGAVTGLAAFEHWKTTGLVTGGNYGSGEGCRPYSIPSDCGQPCPVATYERTTTPNCAKSCSNMYNKEYEIDKYYATTAYALAVEKLIDSIKNLMNDFFVNWPDYAAPANLTTLIKKELKLYGPTLGCFSVNEDFQHYQSGIYTHIAGTELYGHCAKLIGWGTDNGTDYWLFTNTWGRTWGENGHFRLSQNSSPPDEVIAGIPKSKSRQERSIYIID